MFRSQRLIRNIRFFSLTPKKLAFNLELEKTIRSKIDSLPKLDNIFQNPDGSQRNPSDEELKTVAHLNSLALERKLSLGDLFNLSKENESLYMDNEHDLKHFQISSQKIIDKIPYEDSKTGEIKWKIIRENEKEGWENIMNFGFVPAVILVFTILLFKNQDESIDQWAHDELLLRVKEKAEQENDVELLNSLKDLKEQKLTQKELNKRDAIVIERILRGDYDKLNELRLKKIPEPSST
ncbi:hypothetical protein PACTADRAFT_47949 [Pachysolen tannophilus NRRL Y-2460]|uniref:NADH dehydrogenase [ubiquinone] 1 beta subcomplex subunit 11, mitochondrial n=1 Tax=Pachysolen tannophilus NRRL Y-2460 TaxID=669874 RepID=A0A1E4U2B4_PACTA|nr:hypothetical protein PACTADRAFT_47949 [Pachysolen tannophilus NRRL Y-2460]